jgi:predicted  nucleic acid-binding Zn-ribbon protein
VLNTYTEQDGFQIEEVAFGRRETETDLHEDGPRPLLPEMFGREMPAESAVVVRAPEREQTPATSLESNLLDIFAAPVEKKSGSQPPPHESPAVVFTEPPRPKPAIAEAFTERPVRAEASATQPVTNQANEEADDTVARVAEGLAASLANVLVVAIRDLDCQSAKRATDFRGALQEQQQKVESAAGQLAELTQRMERLVETVSEQKLANADMHQKQEELAAKLFELRETDSRNELSVETLRRETQQLAASFTDRLDAVSARLESQQQELSALQPAVSETSPRVAALAERLDRQAEALRSLCSAKVERDAALEQLDEVLTRLKSSWVPADALADARL